MENINDDIKELYVGYVVEPKKDYNWFEKTSNHYTTFGESWDFFYWGIPYIHDYHDIDPKFIKHTILFEIKDKYTVKEILTGVEFDLLKGRLDNKKEWDEYIKVVDDPNHAVPECYIDVATNKDIEMYLKKHKNVNKYRNELLAYKDKRAKEKQRVLEEMEQEMLDKQRAKEEADNKRQSLFNKIIDMRKAYSVKNNDITM